MRPKAFPRLSGQSQNVVGQAYGGHTLLKKGLSTGGASVSSVCNSRTRRAVHKRKLVDRGVVHTGETRRGCPAVLLLASAGLVFTGEKLAFSRGKLAPSLHCGPSSACALLVGRSAVNGSPFTAVRPHRQP